MEKAAMSMTFVSKLFPGFVQLAAIRKPVHQRGR